MNTEIADKIKNRKKLRHIIILNSVVALVSVFPLTITTFAYGAGDICDC